MKLTKVKLGQIYTHRTGKYKVKVVGKKHIAVLINREFVKGHIRYEEYNTAEPVSYHYFKTRFKPSVKNILKEL